MSQTIEADEAGFYSNRRVVREYTRAQKRQRKAQDAVELQEATDQNAPSGAEQKSDGLYASSHAGRWSGVRRQRLLLSSIQKTASRCSRHSVTVVINCCITIRGCL